MSGWRSGQGVPIGSTSSSGAIRISRSPQASSHRRSKQIGRPQPRAHHRRVLNSIGDAGSTERRRRWLSAAGDRRVVTPLDHVAVTAGHGARSCRASSHSFVSSAGTRLVVLGRDHQDAARVVWPPARVHLDHDVLVAMHELQREIGRAVDDVAAERTSIVRRSARRGEVRGTSPPGRNRRGVCGAGSSSSTRGPRRSDRLDRFVADPPARRRGGLA